MKYNFNNFIDRTHTSCVKYDLRHSIFDKSDVIPMWVANMDFETPDFIRDAVIRRAGHPVYGYTFRDADYYQPYGVDTVTSRLDNSRRRYNFLSGSGSGTQPGSACHFIRDHSEPGIEICILTVD